MRSQIRLFIVVALAWTLLLQLPVLLADRGFVVMPVERLMPLVALGAFGPLLAAVVASYRERRAAGVRALFRPLRTWRLGPHWYLIALCGFALVHLLGSLGYHVMGGQAEPWLALVERPEHIVAMVLFPIAEEPGWRGYALPRLQARFGPMGASLVLGVVWTVWHTIMFLVQGLSASQLALAALNIIAGSVLFTWLYNRTRGSLLIALLAHVGAHLNNPARALPGDARPFTIFTVALVVAALAAMALDRRAFTMGSAITAPLQDVPDA